jgi:hypothetical protein
MCQGNLCLSAFNLNIIPFPKCVGRFGVLVPLINQLFESITMCAGIGIVRTENAWPKMRRSWTAPEAPHP